MRGAGPLFDLSGWGEAPGERPTAYRRARRLGEEWRPLAGGPRRRRQNDEDEQQHHGVGYRHSAYHSAGREGIGLRLVEQLCSQAMRQGEDRPCHGIRIDAGSDPSLGVGAADQ